MSIRATVLVIGAITVTTALGIGLGTAMWPGATPDPAPVTIDLGERATQLARLADDPDIDPALLGLLHGLQQDLQAQQEAVERLAVELAAVQREGQAMTGLGKGKGESEQTDADNPSDPSATDAPPGAGMQFRGRRGAVTEQRLIAAGFAADQASEIVSRADAIAMERLNTQYQAAREGWMDTERYREAMSALPDVREELTASYGDDAYDRYLYASGRPNRLVVQDVLQDSPAGAAGLQAGDTVLAMADQRIYSTRDLMAVASSGSEGETVPLVVRRGELTFELYVPRGPLGIRGGRGFEAPSTP